MANTGSRIRCPGIGRVLGTMVWTLPYDSPIVDQLAKDFAGKFKFYKINTDEGPKTANRYGIRSVPTVIVFKDGEFKDGEKKDSIIGAVPRETMEKTIVRFLVE